MKKLFIALLSTICLITLGAGLTACSKSKTEADDKVDEGYIITVKYDPSGGRFFGNENSYLLDMYKPEDCKQNDNGKITIKLRNPVDLARGPEISLEKTGYFNTGWFRKREVVKNALGEVVDENGKTVYYDEITGECYENEKREKAVTPAYTFSDPWDFNSDVLTYNDDGSRYELTLYAAWVPQFTFTYYAKNEKGEWEAYGKTSFDYDETASAESDYNMCYVPGWSDLYEGNECGAITYKTRMKTGKDFDFKRKADDLQFIAAYKDADMTEKITDTVKHLGSINKEDGTAINPDMAIYVDYKKGAEYRIYTAQQLADNADVDGKYTIYRDLDFSAEANGGKAVKWPALFEGGTFIGSMQAAEGTTVTLANILAEHTASNRTQGGLFGKFGNGAVVKNITFKNVTYDFKAIGSRSGERNFGLLAGVADDGAKFENAVVEDATFRISGSLDLKQHTFSVIASGIGSKVAIKGNYKVVVYWEKASLSGDSEYRCFAEKAVLNEDGTIGLTLYNQAQSKSEESETYYLYGGNK